MSPYRPILVILAACTSHCHRATHAPVPVAVAASPRLAPVNPHEQAPSAINLEARCPGDATDAEDVFCRAAKRAIYATERDDSDDAAPLLALINALDTDPQLSRLEASFHPALGHALLRAQILSHVSKALRQLRRAVQDVYVDPRTGLYRGVDNEGCRAAMAALEASDTDWQPLCVTIEPLGTYRLSTFRRFCLESRTLPPGDAP